MTVLALVLLSTCPFSRIVVALAEASQLSRAQYYHEFLVRRWLRIGHGVY
jgi:hypothetical protein